MGYIIFGIIALIFIASIEDIKKSSTGRIFLFSLVVLIVSSIFGAFIPFSGLIIDLSMLVIIGCILCYAYNWIFNK